MTGKEFCVTSVIRNAAINVKIYHYFICSIVGFKHSFLLEFEVIATLFFASSPRIECVCKHDYLSTLRLSFPLIITPSPHQLQPFPHSKSHVLRSLCLRVSSDVCLFCFPTSVPFQRHFKFPALLNAGSLEAFLLLLLPVLWAFVEALKWIQLNMASEYECAFRV